MIRSITNLVVLALVVGVAYSLWNWRSSEGDGEDGSKYAEAACVNSLRNRFDVSRVNVNSVRKNDRGYVVHASVTLSRGAVARATCVANSNGTIEDVLLDER